MDVKKESLRLHGEWKGKIEVVSRVPVTNTQELSLAYTPGVSEACLAIKADKKLSYSLTRRHNTVAVITDGTAVLGLGDIGPEAAMPVMEGKCVLFKTFGNVDAFPLCVNTENSDEFIHTVALISKSFGGINLEDVAAPRCFEIEKKLKEICDIPVFHDDQHGTAVVVAAALLNALKCTGRKLNNVRIVVNGGGSAGLSITRFLLEMGADNIIVCDRFGIICRGDASLIPSHAAISEITNRDLLKGSLKDAMYKADVFIGVSAPDCVTEDMVRSMNPDPIVFPLANPVPEIHPDLAKKAGAAVVGTGSSVFPNQINNVLCFPGIFRGALDVMASDINIPMMKAAALAISSSVPEDKLSAEHIIPFAFDKSVHGKVAEAVSAAAIESHVARKEPQRK